MRAPDAVLIDALTASQPAGRNAGRLSGACIAMTRAVRASTTSSARSASPR